MSKEGNVNDNEYRAFLQRVNRRFHLNVTSAGFKVFRTDADPATLWEIYLNSFHDPVERQHHNCNTCEHFIERFGGLVTIGEDGTLTPAIWDPADADEQYILAIDALYRQVKGAKVTGVFKASEVMLGQALTDNLWQHLAVTQPSQMVHTDRTKTAFQAEAEKLQEYYTLVGALKLPEYTAGNLQTVLTLLNSGQLYRGDKYVAAVKWLLEIVELTKERGLKGYNLAWLKIASAPAGFTKPRGTALGTLIEDVHANLGFPEIKRKFESMLDPETYQRAQAAPAAGAVAQAEKLFEQLGLAPALPRRFAKMSEVLKLWEPTTTVFKTRAVGPSTTFGHLQTKDQQRQAQASQVPTLDIPATLMTWEKFAERVLPTATAIELLVPEHNRFMALTTAENADAPPILKWDDEKQRNPVAWYYDSGADAEVRERVTRAGGMYEGVDIRISLIWNNTDDLDLHVITPQGSHIGFNNKRGCGYGGYLDVDMNVRGETTKPVENIRWARGCAPAGKYQVYVNNYRNRGAKGARITPFMVEIEVLGQIRQFHGEICTEGMYSQHPTMHVADLVYAKGEAPSWNSGQAAQSQWTSAPNTFAKVKAITQSPNLWGGRKDTGNGDHTFFLLEGCAPTEPTTGRSFFPEMLRSELHPVRSVLEAYARQSALGGEPEACGVGMVANKPWNLTLKVTSPGGTALYKIDRKE